MSLGTNAPKGRGPIAVADMKARLEAGWTVAQLWDRNWAAEVAGEGFSYDYAERVQPDRRVELGARLLCETSI